MRSIQKRRSRELYDNRAFQASLFGGKMSGPAPFADPEREETTFSDAEREALDRQMELRMQELAQTVNDG